MTDANKIVYYYNASLQTVFRYGLLTLNSDKENRLLVVMYIVVTVYNYEESA
jgi:hypothetical protein